jgi:protein-tyrosine phosphatase
MTSDERLRSGAILAVCTGNLCRSPVVEWLLRLGLNSRWPAASSALPIASAGTSAAIGQPIPLSFAARLASVGAETSTFAPRQVTREMVAGAELVIAATRAHRATLVEMHPRAVHYTFTMRELARLAAAVPPDDQAPVEPLARLRSFVASAASARGAGMPGDPTAEDVRDPFGGNDARYASVWDTLVDATSEILTALCPVDVRTLTSAGARSL